MTELTAYTVIALTTEDGDFLVAGGPQRRTQLRRRGDQLLD